MSHRPAATTVVFSNTVDGVTRTTVEYEIPISDLSRFTDYAFQDDVVDLLQRWMATRTFHATRTFEHDAAVCVGSVGAAN